MYIFLKNLSYEPLKTQNKNLTMSNKNITNGIALECGVFNESIGAGKDLILINYSDFDLESTASIYNRQTDNSNGNVRGLTDIFLKDGAVKYVFEGTDYSVVPSVSPEQREDGTLWYNHSISFTVYSKKSEDRETLINLGKSEVLAVTRDRSTGLYELFGMYQGLRVSEISRTYTGSQNSNFYQVTISTPDIKVVKEPSLSELSLMLDGGTILPPTPTPGIYGDATPTVQGLVRVDSIETNPIVYLKATVDSLFALKSNILTTEALIESNLTSTTKWPAVKAIVDWIRGRFEPIIEPDDIGKYWRGDKTFQQLDKYAVGLGNVDNTADADKPIPQSILITLEDKADLDENGILQVSQLPPLQVYDETLSAPKQVFDIGVGRICEGVYINGARVYKTTENNTTQVSRWSQTGSEITLTKTTSTNNYIYIEFRGTLVP